MRKKENMPTEEITLEMIRFLQKWGLWKDTSILTNGNRYSFSSDKGKSFQGIPYTILEKGVDPEETMKGITEERDSEGNFIRKSFANPEHIFDMVYEGPLYMLLRHGIFETNVKDISPEAWDYIFEHTDLLNDYLIDEFGASNLHGFYENVRNMSFAEYSAIGRENCMYSEWDPLVFDTWEEYLEVGGFSEEEGRDEAGLKPLYEQYDTYAHYIEEYENFENMDIDSVAPMWDRIVETSKKKYIEDCGTLISIPEVAGHIQKQFDDIFERYGLWYNFCFGWSLTAYSKSSNY